VVTEKSATDALARLSGVARLYVGVGSALRAVTRATCRLGVARLSAVSKLVLIVVSFSPTIVRKLLNLQV
jgi:hypothetical protein